MADLATADINDLPDSDFAYIEPGGTKDAGGKTTPRDKRHFPIQDAAHVRNALARAPGSSFGDQAMPKIKAAAKKFGIGDSTDVAKSVAVSTIIKSLDFVKQVTLGVVYPALRKDGHGEFMKADDLEEMAWGWLRKSRNIGLYHNEALVGYGVPVESYIHRGPDWEVVDIDGKTQVVKSGDWLAAVEWDDAAWGLIMSKHIDGYSFQGRARKRPGQIIAADL